MADLRANAVTLLSTTTGVSVIATGSTGLYTVPTGKVCMPTLAIVECTTFTDGGKAVEPVVSFGFTGAGFDDWINTITVTGMTANDYYHFADISSPHAVGAAAEVCTIIVETASDATAETWSVYLFGFLRDA